VRLFQVRRAVPLSWHSRARFLIVTTRHVALALTSRSIEKKRVKAGHFYNATIATAAVFTVLCALSAVGECFTQ